MAKKKDNTNAVEQAYEEIVAKNAEIEATSPVSPAAASIVAAGQAQTPGEPTETTPAAATPGQTPRVSFEQYLGAAGLPNPNKVYQQTVGAIDADYERALESYGMLGERMAQAGLTGSGYAGSVRDTAFAAAQQARSRALMDRNQQNADYMAAYSQFIANGGTTNTSQQQTQALSDYSAAFNEAIAGGSSVARAYNELAGFDKAAADQVLANYQKGNLAEYTSLNLATEEGLETLAGLTDDVIDGMVKSQQISAEQAPELKAYRQQALGEVASMGIKNAKTGEDIISVKESMASQMDEEQYAAWLPSYYEEVAKVIDISDDTKSFSNLLSELNEDRKVIGEEAYQNVVNALFDGAEIELLNIRRRDSDKDPGYGLLQMKITIDGQSEIANAVAAKEGRQSVLKALENASGDYVDYNGTLYIRGENAWHRLTKPRKVAKKYFNYTQPLYDYLASKATKVTK